MDTQIFLLNILFTGVFLYIFKRSKFVFHRRKSFGFEVNYEHFNFGVNCPFKCVILKNR